MHVMCDGQGHDGMVILRRDCECESVMAASANQVTNSHDVPWTMILYDTTMSDRLLPEGETRVNMNYNFHRQNRCFRSYRFLLSVNLITLTLICLYGK